MNLKSIWTGISSVKSILLFLIGFSVTKASLVPNESHESTVQCSLPFGKSSFGGENAAGMNSDKIDIKSYPFLASYGYEARPGFKTWIHLCTASILSKRALMTAAHCLRLLNKTKN